MSKKKTPTTKKPAATNKELKKTLSSVRGELSKTDARLTKATAKAKRWKKEAAVQRSEASRSAARVQKLQKKLDRAATAVAPTQATEEKAGSGPARRATAVATPDETWSVVQLRAEARARGLVGMSNKPKAHLIQALS